MTYSTQRKHSTGAARNFLCNGESSWRFQEWLRNPRCRHLLNVLRVRRAQIDEVKANSESSKSTPCAAQLTFFDCGRGQGMLRAYATDELGLVKGQRKLIAYGL